MYSSESTSSLPPNTLNASATSAENFGSNLSTICFQFLACALTTFVASLKTLPNLIFFSLFLIKSSTVFVFSSNWFVAYSTKPYAALYTLAGKFFFFGYSFK